MDRVTIVGWSKRARRSGDATFVLNGGGEGTQAVPGGPPSITKGEELEGLPEVAMHGVRSEHRRVEVLRRRRLGQLCLPYFLLKFVFFHSPLTVSSNRLQLSNNH